MAGKKAEPLEVVHPDCAGIDVGKRKHYVAVDPSRFEEPVRNFGTFTGDLESMADRRGLVVLRVRQALLLVAGPGARHAHQRRQAAGGPADETGQPGRAGAAHGAEHRPQQQDRHRRGASPAPLAHGLRQGGQGHRPSTSSADIRHAHPRRGVRRARLGGDGDGAPRPPDQAPAAPSATLRPGPRASEQAA